MKYALILLFVFPLYVAAQEIELLEEHHKEDNETYSFSHLESFNTGKIAVGKYYPEGSSDSYYFVTYVSGLGAASNMIFTVKEAPITGIASMNGFFYFSYRDPDTNYLRLYKTDGSAQGTVLVKAWNVSSSLSGGIAIGNRLLLSIDGDFNGIELWGSDGTEAGTTRLLDIAPGSSDGKPSEFTLFNGSVFFTAKSTGSATDRIYKSDGTAAGTTVLKSFANTVYTYHLQVFKGHLFFIADDNNTDQLQVWKSDGTVAGTVVNQTVANTSYADFTKAGDSKMYTMLYRNGIGAELYVTEGNLNDFVLCKTFGSVSSFNEPAVSNNKIYFDLQETTALGRELYMSDGTVAGTGLLKNIATANNVGSFPSDFTAIKNSICFGANDGVAGRELYVSNGTAAGTVMVNDFKIGSKSGIRSEMIAINDTVYYLAYDVTLGFELWYYTLPSGNFGLYSNLNVSGVGTALSSFTVIDDQLYGSTTPDFNQQSFKKSLNPDSSPSEILPLDFRNVYQHVKRENNEVFLKVKNTSYTDAIYKSDGTAGGTSYVINTNDDSPILSFGDTCFFAGSTGSNDALNLYSYDDYGLHKLSNLDTYSGVGEVVILGKIGNRLFFKGFQEKNNQDYRRELWTYNGTSSSLVMDLNPSGDGYYGDKAGILGSYLYFSGSNGTVKGLYKSNGVGVSLVKEIPNLSSNLEYLEINGTLYFVVDKVSGNLELWKTDGTTAGTILLTDLEINPSDPILSINNLNGACMVNVVSLNTYDSPASIRLWKSDGTVAGAILLHSGGKALQDDYDEVNLENQNLAVVLNNVLYFLGVDSDHGYEIWKSDGTLGGTQLAIDLFVGPESSIPSQFVKYNDDIILAANNGFTGQELYKLSATNPCPDQLNPSGTVSNDQKANLVISTAAPNLIQNNGMVSYQAGHYIQLNPGFSTGTNAVFMTKLLGGCQ